ncbi:MAG TPA: hypothetical protein VF981_05410 [Gemmatimonadaceae bacterium]
MINRRALPVLAALGCSLGTEPAPPEGSVRVLFVGNSLTYVNNLPLTVADLASRAGLAGCYCVQVAYPDFALSDHYILGDALEAIEQGDYDFVVLQQGPSALPDSRDELITWAFNFAEFIAPYGSKTLMYGVWPSFARSFDFPNVRASYRAAADSVHGLFAPAGEAWQLAWQQDPTLPLYAGDQFHPSTMGTYLAAMVVFQRIYGRSPVGVETVAHVSGSQQPWPAATVRLLQEAAAAANAAEDELPAARTYR